MSLETLTPVSGTSEAGGSSDPSANVAVPADSPDGTVPISVTPETTSEPAVVEPGVVEPVVVDPAVTDPILTDAVVADPLTGEIAPTGVMMPMVYAAMPREVLPYARNLQPGLSGNQAQPAKTRGGRGRGLHALTLQGNRKPADSPITVATAQRDLLRAATGTPKSQFQWKQLSDSLLSGRGGSQRWDVVTGFDSRVHTLRAPQSVNKTTIRTASGHVNQLTPALINTKGLGGTALKANSAGAFTCAGYNGTFVVFNDTRPGYQPNSDSLIFLDNFHVNLGSNINVN